MMLHNKNLRLRQALRVSTFKLKVVQKLGNVLKLSSNEWISSNSADENFGIPITTRLPAWLHSLPLKYDKYRGGYGTFRETKISINTFCSPGSWTIRKQQTNRPMIVLNLLLQLFTSWPTGRCRILYFVSSDVRFGIYKRTGSFS